MNTLQLVVTLEILEITAETAHVWAKLRYQLANSKSRLRVNDSWIAALAIQHGLPVVTQDSDFEAIAKVTDLEVIKV